MEAWAIPIRFIIASRRLIYHHNILRRENNELVKRIYQEQVRNPTKGDYSELIKDDFKIINEVQDDVVIQNTNTNAYKTHIKKCIRAAAFQYLTRKQATHSKIKTIEYKQLEVQKYMTSPIFRNEEVNQLFALRSRTTNCKENFKQKYRNDDLLCGLCYKEKEDQPHLLRCDVLRKKFISKQISRKMMNIIIYSQKIYTNKKKYHQCIYNSSNSKQN